LLLFGAFVRGQNVNSLNVSTPAPFVSGGDPVFFQYGLLCDDNPVQIVVSFTFPNNVSFFVSHVPYKGSSVFPSAANFSWQSSSQFSVGTHNVCTKTLIISPRDPEWRYDSGSMFVSVLADKGVSFTITATQGELEHIIVGEKQVVPLNGPFANSFYVYAVDPKVPQVTVSVTVSNTQEYASALNVFLDPKNERPGFVGPAKWQFSTGLVGTFTYTVPTSALPSNVLYVNVDRMRHNNAFTIVIIQ